MSSNSSVTVSGGASTFGLLGVLFIGLKLTGYITWPWVWVLAPFWLGPAILLALLALFFAGWGGIAIAAAISKLVSK